MPPFSQVHQGTGVNEVSLLSVLDSRTLGWGISTPSLDKGLRLGAQGVGVMDNRSTQHSPEGPTLSLDFRVEVQEAIPAELEAVGILGKI